jgi:hypothetical protein
MLLEGNSTTTFLNVEHSQCTSDEWQYVTSVLVRIGRVKILHP